eukprot:CAMPEP_0172439072 /NCGR_PEP_ID=MMETSP1065-20121228/175_1 /TAXON_ID=265537 /ORGANISM="Amphiprora paludosa, Strain CCMP125" /LENGTH=221 /DNA_ID=CAMNT_0013187699 /DNA_START=82 /DNA_END=747 /DNA_ORIENTATION=-
MVASTPSIPTGDGGGGGNPPPGEGEATLLVSEFPPIPFYYRQAQNLTPPPIPVDALERGTKRAAAAAEKMREESERLRMGEGVGQDVIAGGPAVAATAEDDDVVGVFGEIVEDPRLFVPLDSCEDPRIVREEVKRLNHEVVSGFVKLVQDLVNRPTENKKTRDELSHNVFLMLQECNKFREHQARETLIELLEKQLEGRKVLLGELQTTISEADELLGGSL